MRKKCLTQEPAGECFQIKVLLEDDREITRNFLPKGTYQEVYDWVGQETSQDYFTLHQLESGFFSDAKLPTDNLVQSEKLCLITRKKDEANEIFGKDDEVSFYGNLDTDKSLDSTIPDEKDMGEQRHDIEEKKTLSEEPEKKKKKTRKRRKKKNNESQQEGNEKTS